MTRKFIDYARIGKCEVCGKSAPVVVVSSVLGPCSCAYCEECYTEGLEPYSMKDFNQTWENRRRDAGRCKNRGRFFYCGYAEL